MTTNTVHVSWDSGMTEAYDSVEAFEASLEDSPYYLETDLHAYGVRESRIMEDDDQGEAHPVGLVQRC